MGAGAQPLVAERGDGRGVNAVNRHVAEMLLPARERPAFQFERSGLLARCDGFGEVGFDVVGELGFVAAGGKSLFAPVVAQHIGGFLRLDQVRARRAVRRDEREFSRGLLPVIASHPELRVETPIPLVK